MYYLFWSKFSSFEDADKDGIVDPIIVYGTRNEEGVYDNSRIKILIIYKGIKVFIRHQNSIEDRGRYMKIDKMFYTLPVSIQKNIKALMKRIVTTNNRIFTYGWEKNMAQKKTIFSE